MGISGLLPLMKAASTDVHLSKLKGTVAAVDTNGWIHRACYSCADKIYMNEPTDLFVNYCINFCSILRNYNITPILVFDGQSLPAKAETNAARKKRKQEKREQIEEMLRRGLESKARWEMRQCVDVTFEMVREVIVRCRREGIDCLVAPYEADAQMAYLVNSGVADFAITEDSDLLVFGCRRALYKLKRETERGTMIDLDRLARCFNGKMTLRKFQHMCILSGCDYLANIPDVAIGRAKRFFESIVAPIDDKQTGALLHQIPTVLNMAGKIKVSPCYVDGFVRARNTFDHQLVFSPRSNKLCYLNQLPEHIKPDDLVPYAGQFFPDSMPDQNGLSFVINYVLGNVCPKTLSYVDDYCPVSPHSDIWMSEALAKRVRDANTDKFDSNRLYRGGTKKKQKSPSPNNQNGIVRFVREACPSVIKRSESDEFSQSERVLDSIRQHLQETQSQMPASGRYTAVKNRANLFRKNPTNGATQSKYFSQNEAKKLDDSFDDLPIMDLIDSTSSCKKQKTEETDDPQNTSWSSLDEERFSERSSLPGRHSLRSSKRSNSLSTQASSSQASSSQVSDTEPDFICESTCSPSLTSTPCRPNDDPRRGSKRKKTKSPTKPLVKSHSIRKYFQAVER